ncbi:NUDIX hydrolase [Nocardioides conyzicola]|uniref:NUDIX hydrolase n=1 Tax=Nocardioides conyzicola TaxID=1651781 RepID=A0ABP8XZ68_9ACTN
MPELVGDADAWPVADSTHRYDGGWVMRLREDQVQRPGHRDETPFSRLVLEHPGAAIILAVDDQDRALCLWQYRHPVERSLLQLPAGLCDIAGEEPLGVARRELVEEAGFEAAEWTHLVSAYSSPGISEEMGHYFLARGLTEVGQGDFEPEHEEAEMEVRWVPVQELADAVLAGGPVDGHLAIAVLLATARGLAGSTRPR